MSVEAVPIPDIEEIRAARERIEGLALRTPLVRLPLEDAPCAIWLKLECLQPIGSFKIRGAGNALRSAPREEIQRGVYTGSAGNMAQGVAWVARELGVPCSVAVPENAPETKLASVARLGGRVVKLPFDEWWRVLVEHGHPELDGVFVHPVSDPRVIAGNGTIGLEIHEDLPEVDAVIVPYGGGGLSVGIAAALRAVKPEVRVYASEVETAAPLAASLAAGEPRTVEHRPSFVDGIDGKSLLVEMWPAVRELLAGSIVVGLDEIAAAVRLLVERARVVAEGAGASSLAAARTGRAGSGNVVCVVSGGNLDAAKLRTILSGETPS